MTSTCMLGVLLLSATAIQILISSCFTSTGGNTVTKPNKLALRLIHRDSISSPLGNSKPGFSDHMSEDDIRAPLHPRKEGSIFLVNISVGEPPVPQLLAMDTGSPLTWLRCKHCHKNCNDVFEPKRSSTYSVLSGDSPLCAKSTYGFQHKELCRYWARYGDKSISLGVLASETFTFSTSTGGSAEVPDVVFGCALYTNGTLRVLDGILALEAPNKYGLASRSGNKFSYCIGNISDVGYKYNQLILGDGAVLEGDSTPMQLRDQHYFVSIEGISVGAKRLMINQEDFYYNVVIDSGSTYTGIRKSAYEPLIAEVKSLMEGVLEPVVLREAENELCYRGNIERDLKGFPIVTLHLAEGTDVDLDVEAMFRRTADGSSLCLAVDETIKENIIGVRAQQYYNVGFDLDAGRISFQRIDCELLED